MPTDPTYLKALVAQIDAEDDPNKSIRILGNVVLAMDSQSSKRHDKLDVKIDKLSVAILGNGDPEKGMMSRLCKAERWLKLLIGGVAFILAGVGGWLLDLIFKAIN